MTYSPTSWARALLGALGVPVTDANVTAVTAWEAAEGGHWHNIDRYNPLNTSQPMPGATSTNGAGIKAYTSWDQGLTATVKTLQNGLYGGILDALKRGDSADAVVSAVVRSPWGTKKISLSGGESYDKSTAGKAGGAEQVGLLDGLGVSDLGTSLAHTALTGAFLLGGVVLVVLGVLKSSGRGGAA